MTAGSPEGEAMSGLTESCASQRHSRGDCHAASWRCRRYPPFLAHTHDLRVGYTLPTQALAIVSRSATDLFSRRRAQPSPACVEGNFFIS